MVCTAEDDFTRARWLSHPRWLARLDSGETVIDDDGRPGLADSAWLRLAAHVRATGKRVLGVGIQFRSRVVAAGPRGAAGYFLRKAAGAFADGGVTHQFFLVGHLEQGRVLVTRWAVPALLPQETEARDPADPEAVGPSLITFPGGPLDMTTNSIYDE